VTWHLRPLRRKLGRFLTLNLSKSGASKLGPGINQQPHPAHTGRRRAVVLVFQATREEVNGGYLIC
jgi:hypothetical protein